MSWRMIMTVVIGLTLVACGPTRNLTEGFTDAIGATGTTAGGEAERYSSLQALEENPLYKCDSPDYGKFTILLEDRRMLPLQDNLQAVLMETGCFTAASKAGSIVRASLESGEAGNAYDVIQRDMRRAGVDTVVNFTASKSDATSVGGAVVGGAINALSRAVFGIGAGGRNETFAYESSIELVDAQTFDVVDQAFGTSTEGSFAFKLGGGYGRLFGGFGGGGGAARVSEEDAKAFVASFLAAWNNMHNFKPAVAGS